MPRRARRVLRCALVVLLAAGGGERSAAQVDPSGRWRTWHTEHFRVHAQDRLAQVARLAADEAERAYQVLAAELVPPRGTIDIVVADNVDYPNGYATMFPSNRFTIFAVPPTSTSSLKYYDLWLRLLIVHELAHVFHLDRSRGVWAVAQRVFGRVPALFPNAYQPSWVLEGMATYYESRFTGAGRVRGAGHRMLLAAAARGGAWIGDADATLASPKWPGGYRPYAWGAEFFSLQERRGGDSVAARFIEATSGQWWPLRSSRPLQRAGGSSVAAGWRELRVRAESEAAGESRVGAVVARGLFVEPGARLSPDGRRLAYLSVDGRTEPTVIVRSLGDGRVVDRLTVNGAARLGWLGDTLYLAQLDFTSPVDVVSDLSRWVPGGARTRVSEGARLQQPFALPDGRPAGIDVGAAAGSAIALGPAGWEQVDLPEATSWARIASSPDGGHLAGARHLRGQWDIAVWPAGAPDRARAVTDDAALDEDPVWTADGKSVLFASEREGFPQIYRFDLETGRLRRLTREPTGAREPVPTPEGGLFATVLDEDGYALVQLMPVDDPATADAAPPSHVGAAPPTPVRTSGYMPWGALRPRYWIPILDVDGPTGTYVGAYTSGSDPVGRVLYGLWGQLSPTPLRWEGGVAAALTRWKRLGLELSATQSWSGFVGRDSTGQYVRFGERERNATAGATWSARRWRSAASVRAEVEVEQIALTNDEAGGTRYATWPTFVGGRASLQVARYSRPALAISQENGGTLGVVGARRWSLSDAHWSWELRGAAAGYLALPLPGFAHWVLAGRAAVGHTGGSWPDYYLVGGESGDVVEALPGLRIGTGQRAFPVRGYPRMGDRFTRAAVLAVELRIPVALVARGSHAVPLVLDRISATLFGEAAGAWGTGGVAELSLWDVGAEGVFDLGVMRDFPLRFRVGTAVPLRAYGAVAAGDLRAYAAVGSSF